MKARVIMDRPPNDLLSRERESFTSSKNREALFVTRISQAERDTKYERRNTIRERRDTNDGNDSSTSANLGGYQQKEAVV